ncbi:MAG: HAD-IIB family hydrolase [Acholeplasmatales bacterium]|nr:HAD-IIB family hydrolase [Acholeplasmatales bacterium]
MFLNRKNINVYLFDVDGTLVVDGVIPESAIETIKELRDEGNFVMLATGRCQGQLKEVLDQVKVDGFIQNNGGYATLGKEVLYESPINPETIWKLHNEGFNLGVLTKDRYVRFLNTNKAFKKFADSLKIEDPKKGDTAMIDRDKIYSLTIASLDLEHEINPKKYPDLRFIKVSDYGYDVVAKGTTKASAFAVIKAKYPQGHIIAFGDNMNDYEMLDEADLSVSMQGAPDECKKVSSFVTKTAENNGIEFAVNNFIKRVLD